MARRKPCLTCGEQPKARGNARDCHECWLAKQPTHVQIEYADRRLAMVPPELRIDRVPKHRWPPGRRWCSGCQTFVRLRDCNKNDSRCKACTGRSGREYRLERDYSISPADYQRLYEAQGGRCYLCGRRSLSRPLAADHNHKTGELRGLLCPDNEWGCNLKILPRFDADPDPVAMAERLVRYLKDPPARRILGS